MTARGSNEFVMNCEVPETVFYEAFLCILHAGEKVVRVAVEVTCGDETLPTNVVVACSVD